MEAPVVGCTSYYEGTELKANHNDLGARELFSALY